MIRLVRGTGALLVLAGLLVGAPLLLLAAVGPPWSLGGSVGWSARGLWSLLTSPDDGTFLVSVLGLVGWTAWLVLLLTTLVEVGSLLRGRRVRIPGLGMPQHLVRSLLLAVLALAVVPPTLVQASPPAGGPAVAGPAVVAPAHVEHPVATPGEQQRGDDELVHEVVAGDDLWSLAQRYYGEGGQWRRIAEANPDRLTGGADHLEPGWRLRLPGAVEPPSATGHTVTVVAGDTLTGLAERHLGGAERWPELAAANPGVVDDPDVLPVGTVLALPTTAEERDARAADEARARSEADRQEAERAQREHEQQVREDEERRRLDRADPPAEDHPSAPGTVPGDRPEPAPDYPTPGAPSPGTPPSAVPTATPSDPGSGGPGPGAPGPTVQAATPERLDELARIGVLGSTGGLLAAALVGGVARRRAVQLATRPQGRALPVPSGPAQLVRAALGAHQQPLGAQHLGWVQRAVARHCTRLGAPVPALDHVLVAAERISVVHGAPGLPPPPGFEVAPGPGEGAATWSITAAAWQQVAVEPDGPAEGGPVAWPALVSLGRTGGAHLLVCLQRLGMTAVLGPPVVVESAMSALMMELGCSGWADEVTTTLVGPAGVELARATELANLGTAPELEPELRRLERRWEAQRAEHADPQVRRLAPEADTAWTPEVLLLSVRPTTEQTRRLRRLLNAGAPVAVVAAGGPEGASSVLTLPAAPEPDVAPGADAVLQRPDGGSLVLRPQLVEAEIRAAVVELMHTSGATSTTPAPWWPAAPSSAPVDDRTVVRLPTPPAGRKESDVVSGPPGDLPPSRTEPTVLLLGVIELVGARGPAPSRAVKQCVEYCAWLLEHPGRTAPSMASSLVVAEGTRRSNMSRLRQWLGTDDLGEPYLPDAYSGRITLHHGVGSDLDELRTLVAGGVPAAPTTRLLTALRLVRGAPLADAAPGQWGWAEELRIEVLCILRDIALVVTDRALQADDLDLARWAAGRGLTVAPDDERLLVARLRTEHRAGNQGEVERLARRLTRQAKLLQVDLDEDTVILLQQVLEGRTRAREA